MTEQLLSSRDALQAENQRLREALELIVEIEGMETGMGVQFPISSESLRAIARQALAAKGE